jgi:hypothetical protein
MRRSFLTGAAILLAMPCLSVAQTATDTAPKGAGTPAAVANPPATDMADAAAVSRALFANLQQAGFADIRIMPESFIVHATDKSGDPVTMLIDAHSMTVFTNIGSDATGAKVPPDTKPKTGIASPDAAFMNIPARDDLTSQLIGLNVYNKANQDIGTIKDVAVGQDGVRAYIIGVGGFLGMTDHFVAVRPSAVTLSYDTTEKKWHAVMDANADQLKAAPEYKYPKKA